jgi:hypothetical protein
MVGTITKPNVSITYVVFLAYYTDSSSVHWKNIEKSPLDVFTKGSLPSDKEVTIKEPSHMSKRCANGLYHFWYTKQEKGERPLQVVPSLRTTIKKKVVAIPKKMKKYVEVDGDEDVQGDEDQDIERGQEGDGHDKAKGKRRENQAEELAGENREQEAPQEPSGQELTIIPAPKDSPYGTKYTSRRFLKNLSTIGEYQCYGIAILGP